MMTARTPRLILIMLDGLRPDVIDDRRMPHLARLKQRGTHFAQSRTVFPSMTRVAAASFATGAPPRAHGVVANALYLPGYDPSRVNDLSTREKITAFERQAGQSYVQVETFADVLARHGIDFPVLHTGSGASAHLVSPRHRDHDQWKLPMSAIGTADHPDTYGEIAERFGPAPDRVIPDVAFVDYVATVFVEHVLSRRQPDIALLWLHEPDKTWHFRGLGSPEGAAAVAAADAAVGRVVDWLERQPTGDHCTLIVMSDHGHMAVSDQIDLYAALTRMGHACRHMGAGDLGDDSLAVTGWTVGSVTARDGDASRLQAVAEWLRAQDFVGAMFSPGEPGVTEGIIPGTFPIEWAGAQHDRQAPLVFTTAVRDDLDQDGFSGVGPTIGGARPPRLSMHGGLSEAELRNTLIATGPDFEGGKTDARICGLIDVAPTVLDLFGLPSTPAMVGHSLRALPQEARFHRHTLKHDGHGQFLDWAQVGNARYLQCGGRGAGDG